MSKFQTHLINKYKKNGYIVIKTIKLSEAGYPDIILLKNGKATFIEVKEGKDTLKPLQKFKINQLIAEGFEAFCVHNEKGIIYGTNNNQ